MLRCCACLTSNLSHLPCLRIQQDETQDKLDYVLALNAETFLERRLQTLVFKLGLAGGFLTTTSPPTLDRFCQKSTTVLCTRGFKSRRTQEMQQLNLCPSWSKGVVLSCQAVDFWFSQQYQNTVVP